MLRNTVPQSPRTDTVSSRTSGLLDLSSKALLIQVLAQLIVGIGLKFGYQATLAAAYTSDGAMRATPVGAFAASFHYWGSVLLIVHSGLHLLTSLFTGTYRKSALAWYSSVFLFLGAYGIQLTGNLLPMDRHGVQTAVVEGGIAGSMPVAGSTFHNLLLSGPQFGQPTLSSWMLYHSWLLGTLVLLCAIGLVFSAPKDSSSPTHLERPASWPAAMPVVLLAILALSVAAPRGNQATTEDFQSYGAQVSWYTWPLHGLLSAAEKINPKMGWLGFALWPGITVLFLLALPLASRKLAKSTVSVFSVILLAPFLIAGILFGGPIASLTGNRDPIAKAEAPVTPTTKPATRPDDATLLAGKNLFNSSGCSGCHGTNGVNGDSGPSLDKIYQHHSDAAYFVKYVKDPKSVDPASTMPAFPDIPAADLDKIAAWLSTPPAS